MINFVYAMAPGDEGPCKIGYTMDLAHRLSQVQTSCWAKVGIPFFGCFWRTTEKTKHFGDGEMFVTAPLTAKRVERGAHKILSGRNLQGEWFGVTPDEAVDAINKAAAQIRARPLSGEDLDRYFRLYWLHGEKNDSEAKKFVNSLSFGARMVEEYRLERRRKSAA